MPPSAVMFYYYYSVVTNNEIVFPFSLTTKFKIKSINTTKSGPHIAPEMHSPAVSRAGWGIISTYSSRFTTGRWQHYSLTVTKSAS